MFDDFLNECVNCDSLSPRKTQIKLEPLAKFTILIVWGWPCVGGSMYLHVFCAHMLVWLEQRLCTAKMQVHGLGVIPSYILSGTAYLMAFLPCKSHQKLTNNSSVLTDAQASGEPPPNIQTAVNNLSHGREITSKVSKSLCVLWKTW